MATASITRTQAQKLYDYLVEHEQTVFMFAKDQGAYFCGRPVNDPKNPDETVNSIQYVKGCDPNKDGDSWYDTARNRFGGDDFGEQIPREWLNVFLTDPGLRHRRTFMIQLKADRIVLCQ